MVEIYYSPYYIGGFMEDVKEILEEKVEKESTTTLPKKPKNNKSDGFKTKECEVVSYNQKTFELIFNFKGINLRFTGIKNDIGNTITVKYKGEIGKPNFEIKL